MELKAILYVREKIGNIDSRILHGVESLIIFTLLVIYIISM
ncbi:hypothetical protein Mcup_1098 [Metallosphaera cuprina Ar-4]|uniref:Uncharacterized protein n=1 Tax=Metallosphaera cuprina (strain Ar-4) TaxID=1006006 RepID=F4G305_METCR|nr:hypothetical protein Mcup_1098 [Metallosphaera cuprina Ar-4]